jgi:precorrin-2 dehydrogenase / sirohydrochlorin ferrochelatase
MPQPTPVCWNPFRMRYYPVCLDIKDRPCLVVGGGQVGTRKVARLLQCGARVTVISPEVTPELARMARQGQIELRQRDYQRSDLDNCFLVVGATDAPEQNRRIHRDAEAIQRLCNIVDQPDLCNFVLPAVVAQGDLLLCISTSGRSPAFAKYLRRQLQGSFGPEYARFLELMGAVRERLLADEHAPEAHKPLFEKLIHSGLLEMIRRGDGDGINALLAEVLGPGFIYEALIDKP